MNKKLCVEVDYSNDSDGNITPNYILWSDGRRFQIERIIHACVIREEFIIGVRYTILICGKQKQLYHLTDGKWYVDAA